jgi:selenocysteine lyase/cysteine desulfurase
MIDLLPYRKLFPVTERYVYLNHAALCPISTAVAARMQAHLREVAEHGIVRVEAWERGVQSVRTDAARLLGAAPAEVAFVRNTSHGLSLIASGLSWSGGDNLLCAAGEEYPSNVYAWQRLASRGVELRSVPAPGGRVEVEAFARAGDARTRLVAVSSVQYATGWRVDLKELGRLCAERGWLLCVDGIQSVGLLPLDVKAAGIHFLAADSHKWMLGLPGVGILYVDAALAPALEPALIGWRSMREAFDFDRTRLELRPDALRFEEGNLQYALIEGLGASLEMLLQIGVERIEARVRELQRRFVERLLEAGHEVLSALEAPHRSGSVAFRPRKGESATLVRRLGEQGVVVSCRRGAVRVSPHFYNIEDELDRVVDAASEEG